MDLFGLSDLYHDNFWNKTHNFKNNHKNTQSSEMIKSRFRNPSPEIQISKFQKFEIKLQVPWVKIRDRKKISETNPEGTKNPVPAKL